MSAVNQIDNLTAVDGRLPTTSKSSSLPDPEKVANAGRRLLMGEPSQKPKRIAFEGELACA
jgi:hypothetical protein